MKVIIQPPELIEKFYAQWEQGYDVVYGHRVKCDMPWYWGMLYKLFYSVFAAFSYVKIPLDAGDFSLIDRRVVGWNLKCPERDLFMRGLRAYVGFKQIGVDYIRPERMFGKSTNNLIKNVDWAKKGMSNQNKHKRPKYNIEFKQDAVKLVIEKGYTRRQAADNLGISLSYLKYFFTIYFRSTQVIFRQ